MAQHLSHIEADNFRSLANVALEVRPLSVLFGPNGAGKSTLLDTAWFVRDCAIRGVDVASSDRSHGIGALWDRAAEGANIRIAIESALAKYEVHFGYSSGRIEPFVGETLFSKTRNLTLVDRKIGSDKADFYHTDFSQSMTVTLPQPEKLALSKYVVFEDSSEEATEIDRLLRFVHFYYPRSADFYRLRKHGSESNYHTYVWDRYQNLWSVLRNLHDKRSIDERFETIIGFMRNCFPSFKDLVLEQTGPESVYGSFIEAGRRRPIKASGVSDGHLQMLAHLTCLFSEGAHRPSLMLLDEPEISLHPYALAVLANAIKVAVGTWSKQVVVATHSPVLISQFDPHDIVATEIGDDGRTILTGVSDMPEIEDLLKEYATGSLYMSEMIAPQSKRTDSKSLRAASEPPWHGFRWSSRTTVELPGGRKLSIEPSVYLSSREADDMTDRQRKFLRLYNVTDDDGTVIAEMPEIEVERLLGEYPDR